MSQMNQSNQSQAQSQAGNQGDLDQQVQRDLNPNPQNLDPNDPNTAKDPVCGVLVDKRTAKNTLAPSLGTTMETLYFCSANCKALFEQNPEQYGYQNL